MEYLKIAESILRNQEDFFKEILKRSQIRKKIVSMSLSCLVFLAIYGAVMGGSHSFLQSISSLIKLPFLFLVTMAICTPSLHIFYVLFGARQTLDQTIALLLTAMSTTSILLLGFAPITFFFLITSDHYYFFKLLNVSIFAFSGYLGVRFLNKGIRIVTETNPDTGIKRRRGIFTIWVLLYGFVGSQMAWTLSPFMGIPERPFTIISNERGNFFIDVLSSLGALLGVW